MRASARLLQPFCVGLHYSRPLLWAGASIYRRWKGRTAYWNAVKFSNTEICLCQGNFNMCNDHVVLCSHLRSVDLFANVVGVVLYWSYISSEVGNAFNLKAREWLCTPTMVSHFQVTVKQRWAEKIHLLDYQKQTASILQTCMIFLCYVSLQCNRVGSNSICDVKLSWAPCQWLELVEEKLLNVVFNLQAHSLPSHTRPTSIYAILVVALVW